MEFKSLLERQASLTTTTNGAVGFTTTGNSTLDLFGTVGSMRRQPDYLIEDRFELALLEDKLTALRLMFYARDIRGGLGERNTFRVMLKHLANNHIDIAERVMHLIPFYGRWDDMFTLIDTELEVKMFEILKNQLETDLKNMENNESVSLLAKWLKTQNASSKQSLYIHKKTVKAFGMNRKQYQQLTSKLRKYIDVTEIKMCGQEWENIKYQLVPSNCMLKHRNAFKRHDEEGFTSYLEDVEDGKQKINSSTLYPFDILRSMGLRHRISSFEVSEYTKVHELQWKSLPDYLDGAEYNAIVMADTSGSMSGDPILVALSLAVYFAERNTGQYKDTFLTFSERPQLVTLKGENLKEKIESIQAIVQSTDIERAFKLILDTAVNNNVPVDEMPKALIIISDMQFNEATASRVNEQNSLHQEMSLLYKSKGYELPKIVYWNVNDYHTTFQIKTDMEGVQLASGMSTSVFKQIMENLDKSPLEAMLAVLNSPRYEQITL